MLLKQICLNVGLLINRRFKEAHLLLAFYHEFKYFFFVTWTDWSFVKSLKKDASGITSLGENGILKSDTRDKANICNRQFELAFTRETDDDLPSKGDTVV